ncbi:MAG: CapA family protein [Hyphomicrobiaceae bacterium]
MVQGAARQTLQLAGLACLASIAGMTGALPGLAATPAWEDRRDRDMAAINEFRHIAALSRLEAATNLPSPQHRYVTLVIGGDLGFGGSRQPVVATAGVRHGRRHSFAKLTRHLRPLIQSDLAFANLESVVTATNKLSALDKTFTFRMHPNGVAHLVEAGFNVLSTANNHGIDYGSGGMRHTIRHLASLRHSGLIAAHGIAPSAAAVFAPTRFTRNGATFAFAAAGIGGYRAKRSSPGQASYRSTADFDRLTQALARADTAYRMLSVHYGAELQVRPDRRSRNKLAATAVGERGIDLVIGHHAHTPAGVQRVGHGLVFYGLGNLLHLGMQDMGKFGICRDFGLLAKLHLVSDRRTGGRLVAQAIELTALRDMHVNSRPRTGRDGRQRIEVINYLGRELNDATGKRVTFVPRRDGSGLYCAPGAEKAGGAVRRLCSGWRAPSKPSAALQRRIRHSCRYRRKRSATAKLVKLRGRIVPRSKKRRRAAFKRSVYRHRD